MLKELINQVTKFSNDTSPKFIVEQLINLYFKDIYRGSEGKLIIQLYTVGMFWKLLIWYCHSVNYFKNSDKDLKELDGLFTQYIKFEKERTIDYRRWLYNCWRTCTPKRDSILSYLIKVFPDVEDKYEVKAYLGLK